MRKFSQKGLSELSTKLKRKSNSWGWVSTVRIYSLCTNSQGSVRGCGDMVLVLFGRRTEQYKVLTVYLLYSKAYPMSFRSIHSSEFSITGHWRSVKMMRRISRKLFCPPLVHLHLFVWTGNCPTFNPLKSTMTQIMIAAWSETIYGFRVMTYFQPFSLSEDTVPYWPKCKMTRL